MDIKDIKTAYFLGIGGIGMSAIARYFNHLGIKVMGYDKTPTTLTNELIKEGIDIYYKYYRPEQEKEFGILAIYVKLL